MGKFKSARQAQPFLSKFGLISSHFREGETSVQSAYRAVMKLRFALWEKAIATGPILD
jgi:hypothetical protein